MKHKKKTTREFRADINPEKMSYAHKISQSTETRFEQDSFYIKV